MKNKILKAIAALGAIFLFLSGCGQQVVEVSTWEETEGQTQQVQHSSGSKGGTTTTTNTSIANFELTNVAGVQSETATGKTYDLKGEKVIISTHGTGKKPTDLTTNSGRMIADIEKKYNCVIEYKVISSSMGYYSAFASAAQAGIHFSDIARQSTAVAHTKQFKLGYWTPLSDYMDTKEKIFNPSAREQLQYKGKDYLVVTANSWYIPQMLYFNRAIFNKFGVETPDKYVDRNEWTLNNFLDVCRKLTKKDGGTQYYGFATDMNAIGHFQGAFGGKAIIERDGKKYYEPDANLIAGTQFASDMIWKHEVSPKSMQVGEPALKTGTVAMAVTDARKGGPIMEVLGAENVGCTWFPRGENATHKASVGEIAGWGIPTTANDENKAAYCQIMRDFLYPYRWRSTLRESCEGVVGDEKSVETVIEITKYANQHMVLSPLYDYISRTIGWSDKGISKQQPPQAYYDSVKGGAQAELDAFWEQ